MLFKTGILICLSQICFYRRFDIDEDNMGDDLTEQLEEYRISIFNETNCNDGIPTCFSPRSLRPTVRWWKREDKSLEAANGDCSGQLTFTQSRAKVLPKVKANEPNPRPKKSLTAVSPTPKRVIDIDSLDPLTTEQVLNPESLDGCTTDESKIIVDSLASIRVLESEIDYTIQHAKTLAESEEYTSDEAVIQSIWGLDCEWLPGRNCGKDNPVATLQLSTQRCAFLIDLQCMCQAMHNEITCDDSSQTVLEMEFDRVLTKLFADSNTSLIGFGVLADLGKMAASFSHMPCFQLYNGVIDLQKVSSIVFPKSDMHLTSSLQKTVALIFHKRLLKQQQCSDWTVRPLSPEQVEYGLLDAAVLPYLLNQIITEQSVFERYNGRLFKEHPHLISNIRFTFLQDDSEPSESEVHWDIPMGKRTIMFSKQLARQCWPSSQANPDLPIQRLGASISKKEKAHIQKAGNGKRPKPVQLRDLAGKLDDLPKIGTVLGYTKDECAHRVVGHEFISNLPENTHIGFNRRSGVSETTNCWLLFCNFGGVFQTSSGFVKEGEEFRFNLNPKNDKAKSSEKSLYDFFAWQELGFTTESNESDRKILLFARGSNKDKYTYCGECKCIESLATDNGSIDLHLSLTNYEEVAKGDTFFFELVKIGAAQYPVEAKA